MTYEEASRLLGDKIHYCMWNHKFLTHGKYKSVILSGWHGVALMKWCRNGEIVIYRKNLGCWSSRRRVNQYNPFQQWTIFSCRYKIMIGPDKKHGQLVATDKLRIKKDGTINPNQLGVHLNTLKRKYQVQDYLRNKPRRRGRYWVRKARGVYFNRKECTAGPRWQCKLRSREGWPTVNTTYECGCTATIKPHNFKGTVESIIEEANATVRTAKIQMYGIAKFFKDAKAEKIDTCKNYKLLLLRIGADPDLTSIAALRMKCPSTGQIYVNTVPTDINTVDGALNWIYNVEDYLGTVGKQT